MNPVGELLQIDDICLDVDVSSKDQLLEKIAELLARRYRLAAAEVFASLAEREQLGSTGLGHGVAIPHARMKRLSSAAGAFFRTRFPIPFDAPDGRPVSNVLALLVPATATEKHLQLLANAASMFGDRSFRSQLRHCARPSEVKALLDEWSDIAVHESADGSPAKSSSGDPSG
jgi:PTS system nitrogen regulatory IIA component